MSEYLFDAIVRHCRENHGFEPEEDDFCYLPDHSSYFHQFGWTGIPWFTVKMSSEEIEDSYLGLPLMLQVGWTRLHTECLVQLIREEVLASIRFAAKQAWYATFSTRRPSERTLRESYCHRCGFRTAHDEGGCVNRADHRLIQPRFEDTSGI
jgi:hypothetical protein